VDKNVSVENNSLSMQIINRYYFKKPINIIYLRVINFFHRTNIIYIKDFK